jgi:hypothetical protein
MATPHLCATDLLRVVTHNSTLKQVLRAVTTNGDQLAVVCGLGAIVIYIYAVWGFYMYSVQTVAW